MYIFNICIYNKWYLFTCNNCICFFPKVNVSVFLFVFSDAFGAVISPFLCAAVFHVRVTQGQRRHATWCQISEAWSKSRWAAAEAKYWGCKDLRQGRLSHTFSCYGTGNDHSKKSAFMCHVYHFGTVSLYL